jgi:hypothetical protein
MQLELLAPGVEHRQAAPLGPEMLGIGRDVEEALRPGAKEQAIEHAGIVENEGAEILGQGKDGVHVGGREDVALPVEQPRGSDSRMALGTTAVAARVICEPFMSAVIATGFVAAQGRRVAQLDGSERSVLLAAESMAGGLDRKPEILRMS